MDVQRFAEAVSKLLAPYRQDGVNIFKNKFSVSGIARKQTIRKCEKNAFFCLFPKRQADLQEMFKSQICRSLSVVNKRFSRKNETLIRLHKISNPEVRRIVLAERKTAYICTLLLKKIPLIFMLETQNFGPDSCNRSSYEALCWLKWIKKLENVTVQYKFNAGEKRLTDKHLPVDSQARMRRNKKTNTLSVK